MPSYQSVGWIPTANGRLSFRHIGDAQHPHPCRYANFVNDERIRFVAAVQERTSEDFLFSWITKRASGKSGRFWFTIACQSQDEKNLGAASLDSLHGYICIFKSEFDYNRLREEYNVELAINKINDFRIMRNFTDAERTFKLFLSITKEMADAVVEFRLSRNGEVYFHEPIFKDRILQARSNYYSLERIGVDFDRWITNQCYFFLRDICHFHQHHSPADDTILILQDVAAPRGWRNNILYSLQHYVIKLRRSPRLQDLDRALGVLAYAKAFVGIVSLVEIEGDTKLEVFQFDAISSSIEAKKQEIDTVFSKKSQADSWNSSRYFAIQAAYLGILAIAISALTNVMRPFMDLHKPEILDLDTKIWDLHVYVARSVIILSVIIYLYAAERRYEATLTRFDSPIIRKNLFFARDILAVGMFRPKVVGIGLILFACILLSIIWLQLFGI